MKSYPKWSPWFHNWAFNYGAEEAEREFTSFSFIIHSLMSYFAALIAKFPKTDILLTHGPPYHIFDRTNTNDLPG